MMSTKMVTPDLLKITVFIWTCRWRRGSKPVDDVTNKILLYDSNYVVDVSFDQSLVTLGFVGEKLSQPQFYNDLTRKTAFFEGRSWFKFNNLELALGTNLKFCTNVAKGLTIKVRNVGPIPTFVEVTGEKMVRGWVGFLVIGLKGLLFVILSIWPPMFSWFNATVETYWKHLLFFSLWDLLLLFCFLSIQESIYMIHHDSDLFHDIFNTRM